MSKVESLIERSRPRITTPTATTKARNASRSASLAPAPPDSQREEQREEDDRSDLRDRGACDHDLPERRRCLARVLEDRQDDPEACSGDDDCDEERGADEAGSS
jgi:hypothetical protein